MNEHHENPDGVVKQVIDSATALAKTIPVYEDAIRPAAKQIGTALETVGQTVNCALLPLRALVWSSGQIVDWLNENVTQRLSTVTPEHIQTPSPRIACPAIEQLRYCGSEPTIADLYANLIASSMDKATAKNAHPAFIEIIKVLSPDEAKILELFLKRPEQPVLEVHILGHGRHYNTAIKVVDVANAAKCEHPELATSYSTNLIRLGLVELADMEAANDQEYVALIDGVSSQIDEVIASAATIEPFPKADYVRKSLVLTPFGEQFLDSCVRSRLNPAVTSPSVL